MTEKYERFCQGEQGKGLVGALSETYNSGHRPLFVPEIVDLRDMTFQQYGKPTKRQDFSEEFREKARMWNEVFFTPSIVATGWTKKGNPIVVYAHIPNYLTSPKNIKLQLGNYKKFPETKDSPEMLGNIPSDRIPDEKFQRLLDLKDNENIFVIDHNRAKSFTNDRIELEGRGFKKALKDPHIQAFLGGEERAEKYLKFAADSRYPSINCKHSMHLGGEASGKVLCMSGYGMEWGGAGGLSLDNVPLCNNYGYFIGEKVENNRERALSSRVNSHDEPLLMHRQDDTLQLT